MFSTEFALYSLLLLNIFTLIVALIAIINARSARNYASAWAKWATDNAESSVVAQLSGEMTDLTDSYNALLKSHKRLRSRITMRENREKKKLDDEPDDDLSSERDKRALRLKARAAGLLK